MLFACVLTALFLLSTSARALIPIAAAQSEEIVAFRTDAIVVGKVLEVGPIFSEKIQLPGYDKKLKLHFRTATIEVMPSDIYRNFDAIKTVKNQKKPYKIKFRYQSAQSEKISSKGDLSFSKGAFVGLMLQKIPGMSELFVPGMKFREISSPKKSDAARLRKEFKRKTLHNIAWSKPANGFKLGILVSIEYLISKQLSIMVHPLRPVPKEKGKPINKTLDLGLHIALENVTDKPIKLSDDAVINYKLTITNLKTGKKVKVNPPAGSYVLLPNLKSNNKDFIPGEKALLGLFKKGTKLKYFNHNNPAQNSFSFEDRRAETYKVLLEVTISENGKITRKLKVETKI